MRVWVVLVTLYAIDSYAQDTRPTVYFDCDSERCSPALPVPEAGRIDLVIVGGTSRPVVSAAGKDVPLRACASSQWCASDVPVTGLRVTAKGTAAVRGSGALGVGDRRLETAPIRVHKQDDVLRFKLVGPDVEEIPEHPESMGTEHFEDVVLVGGSAGFRCSGVLVTPRHVLTAAHCIPATTVGFGNSMADATVVAITRTTRHPTVDVAVLELASRAELSPRPRRRDLSSSPPLGIARILGFGVSDQVRFTGFGRKRSLSISIDGWGCTEQRSRELGCILGRELLLRDEQGNDTCLGDSGGPLYEHTPDGWRLVGITSRGTRPKKLLCGEGGIYSRVDVIADWIDEVIKP